MNHPNNMTAWDEIRCQRGHDEHRSLMASVSLGGPTGYHDLTSIPLDLRVDFHMLVWDPARHPVDGGPYCPAHDVVSETIDNIGCWEPRETTMMLRAFGAPGRHFVDFGSQIGWYSMIAACRGQHVHAFEADAANSELMLQSLKFNGFADVDFIRGRVGSSTPTLDVLDAPISVAKIDLEGAEDQAVRVLGPNLDAGNVEAMMIEISPCFDDYYPALVRDLMDRGFRAFKLPPKHDPPYEIDGTPASLARWELTGDVEVQVASWHQEDVWFVREDLA